jgi:CRP/FNR family nitrogen fixation transcriptional regulator
MPITLSAARTKPPSVVAFDRMSWPGGLPRNSAEVVTLSDHLQVMQEYGSRLYFRRNETIVGQSDRAGQVYRIVDGAVRLCRHMPDGRRSIVGFLLPGDLMGLAECPDQSVASEAVTEVTLISYPRMLFDRLAKESEEVREHLLNHLSANLLMAQQHMFVLGCQKAKERIASFFLRLADRLDISPGERMDLPMSRQDIADHLGLTIETVCRGITALRSEGAIQVPTAHQVVLQNMAVLRALATEG